MRLTMDEIRWCNGYKGYKAIEAIKVKMFAMCLRLSKEAMFSIWFVFSLGTRGEVCVFCGGSDLTIYNVDSNTHILYVSRVCYSFPSSFYLLFVSFYQIVVCFYLKIFFHAINGLWVLSEGKVQNMNYVGIVFQILYNANQS